MSIWGCGACLLLSASCCWRLYWLQISGVSLTLTWPWRLCLFRVLLSRTATVTSFPLSKLTGGGGATPPSLACVFIYSHVGGVPSPLSNGTFLTQPLLQAFPLQGCWAGAATPAFSGLLVYLQFHEGVPFPPLQCSGLLAVFAVCLFLLLFIIQFVVFSFFPGWGSVCPGDYADLGQGCLWE
jgi:hypothetical protein